MSEGTHVNDGVICATDPWMDGRGHGGALQVARKTERLFLRLTPDDRAFWEGEAVRQRRSLAAAIREGLRQERQRRTARRQSATPTMAYEDE